MKYAEWFAESVFANLASPTEPVPPRLLENAFRDCQADALRHAAEFLKAGPASTDSQRIAWIEAEAAKLERPQ